MGLELLVENFDRVVSVDGSKKVCEELKLKFRSASNLTIVHSMIEDFEWEERFDNIVLAHVLEHVENPEAVLKKVKKLLKKGGVLFITVPNSHSIHKQAAVLIGLLDREDAFSKRDKLVGHKRVMNLPGLISLTLQVGYNILTFGGYFLKPLSNGQIQKWFTEDMIHAFMKLGELYPDIAAEIYVVATH